MENIANSSSASFCAPLKKIPSVGAYFQSACLRLGLTPGVFLNMIIALSSLALVGMIWTNRGPVARLGNEVGTRISDVVNRVTQQIIGTGQITKAYLEPVQGFPENEVSRIDIYGETPIGRDREYAQLTFDIPQVSRLHCTIHESDLNGTWTIEDEDSSNGTYLNGEKLLPFEETRLKDGDLLELGKAVRGGIKFAFHVVDDVFYQDGATLNDVENKGGGGAHEGAWDPDPEPEHEETRVTPRPRSASGDEETDEAGYDPSDQVF
jgi:hypothetical protein